MFWRQQNRFDIEIPALWYLGMGNGVSGDGMADLTELSGRKIFLVEDESLVALMIEAMIEELGASVIGTESRIEESLAFIARHHSEIDVGVLDLNLGGSRSYDIAQALTERGIPLVFSTGYSDDSILPEWRNRPLLGKPFQLAELESALKGAVAMRAPR